MKNALIIGGSGNLGTVLIDHFSSLGYRVINISRTKPSNLSQNDLHIHLNFLNSNISSELERELVEVHNIDVLIMAAAMDSYLNFQNFNVDDMQTVLQVNCFSYIEVLNILISTQKIASNTSVIGFSSDILDTYEKDSLIYGVSKAAFEEVNRQLLTYSIVKSVHVLRLPFIGVKMKHVVEKNSLCIDGKFNKQLKTSIIERVNMILKSPPTNKYSRETL